MSSVGDRESDRKPLVLLLEDDAELLQLAELVLEEHGLRVVTASSGVSGLARLDVIEPDVIVTDMMMPELDGLGFLQAYAQRPPPRAPVIAVSGFSAYLEEARRLGAVATLEKPYDASELAALSFQAAEGRAPHAAAIPPSMREDEAARLRAVFDLQLESPPPELKLEAFLDDVATLFDVPVSGISEVGKHQQRLVVQCTKATPDPGGPREASFCTHAVAARAALVVQDARANSFFKDNPSVTERGFSFYAGVPLMASRGEAIGTLCILDFEPHHFSHLDLELLELLAQRVLAALEWRDKYDHRDVPDCAYDHLGCLDTELGIYGRPLFRSLIGVQARRGIQRKEPVSLAALAVPSGDLTKTTSALRAAVRGGLIGRLGTARLGAIAYGKTPPEAQLMAKRCAGDAADVATTELDRYQGTTDLALAHVERLLGRAGLH